MALPYSFGPAGFEPAPPKERMSSFNARKTLWATSSFSMETSTSPAELSALGSHKESCRTSRSSWFAVQCAGDALRGFVQQRLFTSLALIATLAGLGALAL